MKFDIIFKSNSFLKELLRRIPEEWDFNKAAEFSVSKQEGFYGNLHIKLSVVSQYRGNTKLKFSLEREEFGLTTNEGSLIMGDKSYKILEEEIILQGVQKNMANAMSRQLLAVITHIIKGDMEKAEKKQKELDSCY